MNILRDSVTGIFLLILAFTGSFLQPLFGCRAQKQLSENMYLKHIALIFTLYFTVSFVGDDDEFDILRYSFQTFIIYIFFIMFTKMNLTFSLIVFVLLFISYNLNSYKELLNKKEERKYDDLIEKIQKTLISIIALCIVTGFIIYYNHQRGQYKNNWSTLKFLFGINKCKSLQ